MSGFGEITDDLRRRISELERKQRSQDRTGVIAEIDAGKGLARVKLLDGETPFLTGWIPWEEPAAGANKTHNPPSLGQQVKVRSETGDLHDASIQGSLNSDSNARPSGAGDEYVLFSVGAASIKSTGGGTAIVFTVGGVSLTITAAGTAIVSGTVSHNGINIGDTHTHPHGDPDTDSPN